jgi:nicotinate-nucleotide adenylyltransferase
VNAGKRRRRLGVFGGTFDPPHVGHLLAARDAAERLALDIVLWVPVGTQPLKPAGTAASGDARLAMVTLTVADTGDFQAESIEVRRQGLSFTVDTLQEIRGREPDAELFLLLGEDSWATFDRWREPDRIRQLARVAVLARNERGFPERNGSATAAGDAPLWLETRRVDVSATEIRERVRTGLSIRGFVPESVERYIAEHSLYR